MNAIVGAVFAPPLLRSASCAPPVSARGVMKVVRASRTQVLHGWTKKVRTAWPPHTSLFPSLFAPLVGVVLSPPFREDGRHVCVMPVQ